MSASSFKIAIVGGGPAGLTLGLLLHKRNIPFTIFELRKQPTEAETLAPVGSLDLHQETGLAALRECGVLDEFQSNLDDCAETQKISNKHGSIIFDEAEVGEEGGSRPEISRNKLIKLLFSNLPASTIKWGHKVLSARELTIEGQTKVELDFGEQGKETFDLAVGADGAWSKIRPILTDVKPHYAGIQYVNLHIREITTRHAQLADFIGRGTFSALADKHGVCAQRAAANAATMYIFISTQDEHYGHSTGLAAQTPREAKDLLLGEKFLFKNWGDMIKELVSVACDDEEEANPGAKLDIKPLYRLPIGHSWKHRSCATVIGDAAHLFNPGAGEGVNQAMRDSLGLSRVIEKALQKAGQNNSSVTTELSSLMAEFEVEMIRDGKRMSEDTLEVNEIMFGDDDGAAGLKKFFLDMQPPAE